MGDSGLPTRIHDAVADSLAWFRASQRVAGYWVGEVETNSAMDAEYLMAREFLGVADEKASQMHAADILDRQGPEGAWAGHVGGPGDVSITVECYLALKLCGLPASSPELTAAREFIAQAGGISRTHGLTRLWLLVFGQIDWNTAPTVPPELILAPRLSPLSIYSFASWARLTMVPLLILLEVQPTHRLTEDRGIGELEIGNPALLEVQDPGGQRFSPGRLLWRSEQALKLAERLPFKPLRARSLDALERWILEHQEADGTWGGLLTPTLLCLVALQTLGHDSGEEPIRQCLDSLAGDAWTVAGPGDAALRIQTTTSPVWDTALATAALAEATGDESAEMRARSARWIVPKQAGRTGDWAHGMGDPPAPGGWAFEFDNELYPDLDDTAMAVIALDGVSFADDDLEARRRHAIETAVAWVLAMQSGNGGWAAFDKDNTSRIVATIPFLDFGDALDPPTADITAHVIEMFAALRASGRHLRGTEAVAVDSGVQFLLNDQEADGAWFGRWGVNYVYGTGAVLSALGRLHADATGSTAVNDAVRNGIDWLLSHQDPSGGWGETCESYANPSLRGTGAPTPTQTAWALLGLAAVDSQPTSAATSPAEQRREAAIRSGAEWLLARRRADGTWQESEFTGCAFVGNRTGAAPRAGNEADGVAMMIKYHSYATTFATWALGRVARSLQ